jgi:hypothetical protein
VVRPVSNLSTIYDLVIDDLVIDDLVIDDLVD